MKGQETKYTLIKEIEFPNARFRVYSPDISEEERARRFEELKKEVARFMVATEQAKRKKVNG